MPIMFRFRWIPFLATVVLVALGVALGQWQTRRATEKQAIEATMSQRTAAPPITLDASMPPLDALEYRRAIVRGEFISAWPLYLENRPHNSIAGFYVLMPFKIAGSTQHVMIARGWVPRDPRDRAKLPPLMTPNGQVELQGMITRHAGRLLQLGQAVPPRPNAILQNMDVAEFAQASKLSMQPFVIEQQSDTQDGLIRDWPRPSAGIDKHLGYAFQWYGLAGMAFLFFVVTGLRRGTR